MNRTIGLSGQLGRRLCRGVCWNAVSGRVRPVVRAPTAAYGGLGLGLGVRSFGSGRPWLQKVEPESAGSKASSTSPASSVSSAGSASSTSSASGASKTPSEQAENSASQQSSSSAPVVSEKKKTTIWEKVKHEAQHYWDGTKLLGYEVKVSFGLALKMFAGGGLTRREHRQLKRTLQDIVRLVPFSMFVIVPFAELLLPVALKLFPNMLPSTYESEKDKQAKSKKLRHTRGKVSAFLRQTVTESGVTLPVNITPEQREQFSDFFKQIRSGTAPPSRDQLVEVARLFKDDVVLDNLSRPQLVATAKYMNLQPYGTNVMLRYSIRHRMRQIKRDDRAIDKEGVDSLSVPELKMACASRGIKTHGVSPAKLRDDMGNWLELRLHQKVPSTLLVLSSAYTYGEAESLDSHYDAILAVLSAIPEELYHEAELEVSSEAATNKQRLEVLKEQQELIADENAEEAASGHTIPVQDNLSLEEEEEAQAQIRRDNEAKENDKKDESDNKEKQEEDKNGKS
uniref:ARAD1C14938p n=1 Tax=Blastobotrys adeninivorans TaxID=409370 RepID=A0A060T0A3_BLAAD